MNDIAVSIDPPELAGCTFTPTGAVYDPAMSFEQYQSIAGALERLEHQKQTELAAVQWWRADLLRFGEHQWGETYAQAAEETGLAEKTLANRVWTANAFDDPSRRREELSFSHHSAVAGLPPEVADQLLDEAEANAWSEHTLRDRVRQVRLLNNGKDPDAERFRHACSLAVDALGSIPPGRWAELIATHLIRPSKWLCSAKDYGEFLDAMARLAQQRIIP